MLLYLVSTLCIALDSTTGLDTYNVIWFNSCISSWTVWKSVVRSVGNLRARLSLQFLFCSMELQLVGGALFMRFCENSALSLEMSSHVMSSSSHARVLHRPTYATAPLTSINAVRDRVLVLVYLALGV